MELPQTLSKSKIRRLNKVIREYSKHLGLNDPGVRFSARQHIIRICNKFPRIKAQVRPLGGKVNGEQAAAFLRYMVENPIGEFQVLPDAVADRVRKENPKVERRILTKAKKKEHEKRQQFYDSWAWKKVRYQTLQKYGPRCMLCGATREDVDLEGKRVRIVVDHIKPLYTHWELRLEPENLQVLCYDCNKGKGAWDETDWRATEAINAQLRYKI